MMTLVICILSILRVSIIQKTNQFTRAVAVENILKDLSEETGFSVLKFVSHNLLLDHSFSTYAKFSEKLIFLAT